MKKALLFVLAAACVCKTTGSFAQPPVNVSDSLALVDLYNSTGGDNWTNNAGWLEGPVSVWHGITLDGTGTRIFAIGLSGNNLTGSIPSSIENLTALTSLDLSSNKLTGSIPSSIGNLTNLEAIALGSNQLTDTIPSSIGNLSSLSSDLDLSSNQLTGSIPSSIGNLTALIYLDLSSNQLTDSIPSSIGNLTNLFTIYLNNNQLTGSIPSGIGNAVRSLIFMNLSNNQLSGIIPSTIGNLGGMINMNLSNNQLSGSIPVSIFQNSRLTQLRLNNNQLSGSLPYDIGSIPTLAYLDLSDNQLSGSIPSAIGGLTQIQSLDLSNNQLTGTVPSVVNTTNFPMIQYLNFSGNMLTGNIPSIGLSHHGGGIHGPLTGDLTYLNLSYNDFNFTGMEEVASEESFAVYAPQSGILTLNYSGGQLSVTAGGTLANDSFHWYKDNVLYKTIVGDSILAVTEDGSYWVAVTNAVATQLTLHSDTVTIVTFPIKLLSFTATKEGNQNLLQWTTANEVNSSYFTVEKSGDGVNFADFGSVIARGNSVVSTAYSFTDDQPKSGMNYYRLRLVDKDGKFVYSEVRSINMAISFLASIYPNPVQNSLNLSFNSDKAMTVEVEVVDNEGKAVAVQQVAVAAGASMQSINTASLSNGEYYVRLVTADGESELTFVKER